MTVRQFEVAKEIIDEMEHARKICNMIDTDLPVYICVGSQTYSIDNNVINMIIDYYKQNIESLTNELMNV